MARSHLRFVVRDLKGNSIQNALAHVYGVGTTTPVTDMWTAKSGGSNVSTLTSDGDGEIEGWIDVAKQVDIVVTDNGHNAFYPENPATKLTFADLAAETIDVPPPADTILTSDLLGAPNGIAILDGNGDVVGPAQAADIATLQGQIDALAARVSVLEGTGGGGGSGASQVVPMGMYSGSDSNALRTVAMVNDPRWNVPLARWFSAGADDSLATAKSTIDSASRAVLINLPQRIGGVSQQWSAFTAGSYDSQLTTFFTNLNTWVSPDIKVTWIDEPDGTNNPFAESVTAYWDAFNHIKAIAAAHAPNVKMGFSLGVATRYSTWLPAHLSSIDFLGWNPYNRNSPWLSFAALLQRDYPTVAASGKPLIMTTGSVENPNDPAGPNSKKTWYVNMGNTLLTAPTQYPLLSQIYVWDSGSNPDFHVDTSANSLAGFKTLVATDFTSAAGGSTIAIEQLIGPNVSSTNNATVASGIANTIPVGRFIILVVRGNGNPAGTPVTITDTKSNTWQQDVYIAQTGAAKSFIGIYSCKVTVQLTNADSITATLGSNATNKDIAGIVVTGLNGTTWKDQVASAAPIASATVDSGATAMTAGAGLIFGGAIMALPLPLDSVDDGNGHAMTIVDDQQLTGTNNRGVSCGYALVPGAEAAHYVANSHGNSGLWAAACVAYKT